jgi:hypothetical protein
MFGTIIAIGIVVLLIVYLVGRYKKEPTKQLIKVESDAELLHDLDLRPGEIVQLVVHPERNEVDVFSNRSTRLNDRLGVIKNRFIYDKIFNKEAGAKVHSVNKHSVLLQLTETNITNA